MERALAPPGTRELCSGVVGTILNVLQPVQYIGPATIDLQGHSLITLRNLLTNKFHKLKDPQEELKLTEAQKQSLLARMKVLREMIAKEINDFKESVCDKKDSKKDKPSFFGGQGLARLVSLFRCPNGSIRVETARTVCALAMTQQGRTSIFSFAGCLSPIVALLLPDSHLYNGRPVPGFLAEEAVRALSYLAEPAGIGDSSPFGVQLIQAVAIAPPFPSPLFVLQEGRLSETEQEEAENKTTIEEVDQKSAVETKETKEEKVAARSLAKCFLAALNWAESSQSSSELARAQALLLKTRLVEGGLLALLEGPITAPATSLSDPAIVVSPTQPVTETVTSSGPGETAVTVDVSSGDGPVQTKSKDKAGKKKSKRKKKKQEKER
eukprot:g31320.t1